MATFKICVFDHQKRNDEKYPVSIRVYWKGQSSYIGTEFYVTEKQLSRKKYTGDNGKKKEIISLKDIFIINELNNRIAKYEELKSKKLGFRIEMYTARELAKYFEQETKPGSDTSINFIDFAKSYIDKLKTNGKNATAGNLTRTINAMIDFCNGREKIAITEISARFLQQFEIFLKNERTIKRKNQFGRIVATKSNGLSEVSIYDYMNDIRVLFNAAISEYNDEDKDQIRIMHYPFRKYKLQRRPESEKRTLTTEQIAEIINLPDNKLVNQRAVFARDMFTLSFYLIGMNTVDLYNANRLENGRVLYERSKTTGRRQDRAFISVRIEPEALHLVEKYMDKTGKYVFDFYKRYSDSHTFGSNVNKGLKEVAAACGISEPLSTYYARHSWATIARNDCNISKDDIDLALNHVDQAMKMTDIYIKKDWSRIDKANRAVIDLIEN